MVVFFIFYSFICDESSMAIDVVGKEVWSGSLPCDLASFWAYFWREELFYESQMALQGNVDVQISPWQSTSGTSLGRRVEANHEIRVKIPGAPSHAHNSLKQTVTVDKNAAHEVSLSITDNISVSGAMYSDHFCVETNWTVVEEEGHTTCSLTVVARVIFLKDFPWHLSFIKKAISSNTFAETSESVAKWYSGAMAKLKILQPQPRMSTTRDFPPTWFQAANPGSSEIDRSVSPKSPHAKKAKVGKILLNQVFASRSASIDEGNMSAAPTSPL